MGHTHISPTGQTAVVSVRTSKLHRQREGKGNNVPGTSELDEINRQIAIVRDNIRELTEQAAAFSGARDEDLAANRIATQEAQLATLMKRRDALTKKKSK